MLLHAPRSVFFLLLFLPLGLRPAVLLATLSAADERSEIRGDRHNKSQSAEMKINDRLTQPSLKSGFEKKKKQKCLSNEKERRTL